MTDSLTKKKKKDEMVHQGGQQLGLPVATAARTSSASYSLSDIADWDGKSQSIEQILVTAFKAEDYSDCIGHLGALNIDPLSYINNLDKVCVRQIPTQHAQFLTVWLQIIHHISTDQGL